MLRIVCVKHGNKYGPDYVNILRDMVLRNLPEGMGGEFVCFTDEAAGLSPSIIVRDLPNPELTGWWHKLSLFKDGLFDDGDRIIYMDLDTVITGPLDDIVAYEGEFAILRDFYRPDGMQSSIMAWPANTMQVLWDAWCAADRPNLPGGDQEVIEGVMQDCRDLWQDMYPGDFVSFKEHARFGIPKGAKVVVFHGEPRPHEVTEDWVPKVWKIGGGTSAELVIEPNIPEHQIIYQIKSAMLRDAPWLQMADAHDGIAMVCAGGPSLARDIGLVKSLKGGGVKLFCVNGTYQFLSKQDIAPDVHVMLDGRQENICFVPVEPGAQQIYASQCHPDVLDAAGDNLTLYHPYFDGILDIVGEEDGSAMIGGGTTAGLKAVCIAFALGYRKIHMFGFDSAYEADEGHAYPQLLNAKDRILDVSFDGKDYKCAPWMITQSEDFERVMPELVSIGAEIYVHGDGLIPAIAEVMGRESQMAPADLRAHAILKRLSDIPSPVGAEIGVFGGDLSKRLLSRSDLKLYLVDSWSADHSPAYAESGDFHASLTQAEQDAYADYAKGAVSFAKDRATIIRKPSVEAANDLPDGALDFAFIDADHSYDGCKADILAWLPKVKPGGIICGHDYNNTDYPCFGVQQAVDEVIGGMGWALELGENFTWFATKQRNAA